MACLDGTERRARMLMSWVAEPGDPDVADLIREYGAVALVDRLRHSEQDSPRPLGWRRRLEVADVDALAASADAVSARYLCPGDPDWPTQLDDLQRLTAASGDRRAAAPFGLWVRGGFPLAAAGRRSLSVVGARASSAYGEHVAGELAATCGSRGFAVVSGGAYGIDAAAHRGALVAPAPTVAVLAGGIDRLYPAGNTSLLRTIAREGLVIAEAAPGCVPTKSRFLVRNRIIAALSLGTVVVEAALRSGALSTARWARDLDRQVMGVPGPVTSMTSAGVHELLRQPGSVLVTDADEVIEQISPMGEGLAPPKSGTKTVRDSLDVLARLVLDAVPRFTPAEAGSIATVAGLPVAETSRCLEQLATAGLIEGGQDGGWRLVPN